MSWNSILMRKGRGVSVSLGRSNKQWLLGKMDGACELVGGMIVCDWACLGVVWASSPLSRDKNQYSLVDGSSRKDIYDNWVSAEGPIFRQIRGVPRKPLPALAVFQVPTAQNNQYTEVVYFGGVFCSFDISIYLYLPIYVSIIYRPAYLFIYLSI